jgi:hypothetical protein
MANFSNPENLLLKDAILNTIAYADVFDYPLSAAQVQRYLTGLQASPETVSARLERLSGDGNILRRVDDYYLLAGREHIVETRQRRQAVAQRLWPKARRYGRLIANLPFVRMLAVTGSLAMDNAEGQGDIDYMIVTVKGRVWLCRLLVLGVVRLAAWQKVNLCSNYLVAEDVLEIPARNLYSAHEFAQMIPLAGADVYENMRRLNPWVKDFLPNADGSPGPAPEKTSISKLRGLLEKLLLSPLGERLERWEMERKVRKLARQNSGNPEAVFNAGMCKGHADRHGQRTELLLNERLARLALETRSEPEALEMLDPLAIYAQHKVSP